MCTEVNNSQELELATSPPPPPGNGPLKGPRVGLSLGFSSADPEQPRDDNQRMLTIHLPSISPSHLLAEAGTPSRGRTASERRPGPREGE